MSNICTLYIIKFKHYTVTNSRFVPKCDTKTGWNENVYHRFEPPSPKIIIMYFKFHFMDIFKNILILQNRKLRFKGQGQLAGSKARVKVKWVGTGIANHFLIYNKLRSSRSHSNIFCGKHL